MAEVEAGSCTRNASNSRLLIGLTGGICISEQVFGSIASALIDRCLLALQISVSGANRGLVPLADRLLLLCSGFVCDDLHFSRWNYLGIFTSLIEIVTEFLRFACRSRVLQRVFRTDSFDSIAFYFDFRHSSLEEWPAGRRLWFLFYSGGGLISELFLLECCVFS